MIISLRPEKKKIRHFVKTPSTRITFLPNEVIKETIDACHSETVIAMNKDLVLSMFLSRIVSVPMWLGCDRIIVLDHSKTLNIEYLSYFNEVSKSLEVAQETKKHPERNL